jgi:hypothetical protein
VVVGSYELLVGSAPGLADLATFEVGPVTAFSVEAPAGLYFVSVRARTACAAPSLPSNTVPVGVP